MQTLEHVASNGKKSNKYNNWQRCGFYWAFLLHIVPQCILCTGIDYDVSRGLFFFLKSRSILDCESTKLCSLQSLRRIAQSLFLTSSYQSFSWQFENFLWKLQNYIRQDLTFRRWKQIHYIHGMGGRFPNECFFFWSYFTLQQNAFPTWDWKLIWNSIFCFIWGVSILWNRIEIEICYLLLHLF